MPTIHLLKTHKLKIFSTEEGYYTSGGRYVEGTESSSKTIECNVQPYREGKKRSPLPEGVLTTDAIIIYTKSELKTANEHTKDHADETEYNNLRYVITYLEDWSGYGLSSDHYKYVAIKKTVAKNI